MKIKDVAKIAGVSTATVSRALSNPGRVNEVTRKLVLDAVKATGYRGNQGARQLRSSRSNTVLVLAPHLENPFFSTIFASIETTLTKNNYSLLIADSKSTNPARQFVDYFIEGRVDGMIILDGDLSSTQIEALESSKMSAQYVFACEWTEQSKAPSIRSDNQMGAKLAINHLHELGHRNIAHVTGPEGNVLTKERRKGMLAAREELGLVAHDDWIIRGDFTMQSGYEAGLKIAAMKERPTAVFCASDPVALGLISALSSVGISVPNDISVVGFDNIESSEFFSPRLTTINQNRRDIGTRAADVLLERLKGETLSEAKIQTLDVELVIRDSTSRCSH